LTSFLLIVLEIPFIYSEIIITPSFLLVLVSSPSARLSEIKSPSRIKIYLSVSSLYNPGP